MNIARSTKAKIADRVGTEKCLSAVVLPTERYKLSSKTAVEVC